MPLAIPRNQGRSLRGRQVAEYLRGQPHEDSGDDSQTHLHRSSGGDDPSDGAGGSDSGDELSATGAEG